MITRLEKSQNANDLISLHSEVSRYYSVDYSKKEELLQFAAGKVWTNRELQDFALAGKKPVSFAFAQDSQRAFVGAITQNRYDITFKPTEDSDQGISDVLKYRYTHDAYHLKFAHKDIALIQKAWATGSAWQELYVYINPGDKPKFVLNNENVVAIYPDPNSKPGDRRDAKFIQRVKFISVEDLKDNFRNFDFTELENKINQGSYEQIDKVVDRGHEDKITRNGLVKVIEHFYKCYKSTAVIQDDYQNEIGKIEESELGELKKQYPDRYIENHGKYPDGFIYERQMEYLCIAIICPAWSETEYLYNGRYHSQPRDPRTKDVLWPFIELVAEENGDQAMGFAELLKDPVKLSNSIITQILHSARFADSGNAFKPDFFIDEKEAQNYAKYGSDPTRKFRLKAEAPADTFIQIPRSQLSREHTEALNLALNFIQQISSTPPALKGQQEAAQTSGKLNEQRINQSFIQLQTVIANYKNFLKSRAELLCALWIEYNDMFIDETFRIMEKNNVDDPDFITINQLVEERDERGILTGRLKKINDPSTMEFDTVIADSYSSPVMADKMRGDLIDLLGSIDLRGEPMLLSYVAFEILKTLDLPLDVKANMSKMSQYIQQKQQMDAQAQQVNQQVATDSMALDNAGKEQNIAAQQQAMELQQQMPPELALRGAA